MCREQILVPQQLRDWYFDDTDTDSEVGIEGLSISLHISTPIAAEIYCILKLPLRQLLVAQTSMSLQ